MSTTNFNFTTGPACLPDVGTLSYNGCTFSPLFASTISGTAVKDAAKRTTKLMEYVLEVDGYVTAPGAVGINTTTAGIAATMASLASLLTAQAGALVYKGRGFDFTVNAAGVTVFDNAARDVEYGPVPEMLEFQPLGAGLSAKVKWRVTFRVVHLANTKNLSALLEFNCDTAVTYGEDGFSSLSVNGTMEIPATRTSQGNRKLAKTVDDMRSQLDTKIFAGIDLNVFRVVRREYPISRDKRTMNFSVEVEEKPYMDLPPGCTVARGNYSVQPTKVGPGLAGWVCTLRATYTVRADAPRRTAWYAFLILVRLRMMASVYNGEAPGGLKGADNLFKNFAKTTPTITPKRPPGETIDRLWESLLRDKIVNLYRTYVRAWVINFGVEEGLYLDSKTVSFSISWRLTCPFAYILLASGVWTKVVEQNKDGNLWAITMKDISGSNSWTTNPLNAEDDVIVDFGSVN